jgi:DNA topoisomerase-1
MDRRKWGRKLPLSKPIFDVGQAKAVIEKGRRAKWLRRVGTMSRGFHYEDAAGKKITSAETIERIRLLVIPPAWRYVRISPSAGSRLQAVGMDTTGRIQYLYHPKYSERQQRKKFEKDRTVRRIHARSAKGDE